MSDITKALLKLRPGAKWTVEGNSYCGITWLDENQTKPSESEIADELAIQENEFKAIKYKRERMLAYPSFEDQFDLLYHGGYDAWKAAIDEVKMRFPKP